ncbi:hypothetical protein GCM10020229_22320 [Kitasatospora albolonga]
MPVTDAECEKKGRPVPNGAVREARNKRRPGSEPGHGQFSKGRSPPPGVEGFHIAAKLDTETSSKKAKNFTEPPKEEKITER